MNNYKTKYATVQPIDIEFNKCLKHDNDKAISECLKSHNISYEALLKLFNDKKISFNVFSLVSKDCSIRISSDKSDTDRDIL